MLIIKVGDNENKRWKRSGKKKTTTKTEKNIGGQKLQWKAESQMISLCV